MTDKANWVVNKKGNWGRSGYEISVVRDNFAHGKLSYGWQGDSKIILATDSEHHNPLSKEVWDILMKAAQQVADDLNSLET